MLDPPPDLSDTQVLAAVAAQWSVPDDAIAEHQALGFGAHHWRVAQWFVTWDRDTTGVRRTSLEAAYASAAALAESGLGFVLAPAPTREGAYTVPLGPGTLSVTPWRSGTTVDALDVSATRAMIEALHTSAPPVGLLPWAPGTGPELTEGLVRLTADPWDSGPYGEAARTAVRAHLDDIARWSGDLHRLAEIARRVPWVPTHGEPHWANQLITRDAHYLVDWETLRLAPPERDLRELVAAGVSDTGARSDLIEMFDLEWRLDEIEQYAHWFAAAHAGTRSDHVAWEDLCHELTRP